MINLTVVGGGEGFHKNLYPALQSPELKPEIRVATLIDILPQEMLHEKTRRIIAEGKVNYVRSSSLSTRPVLCYDENPAAMIMTPNNSHLFYAEYFSSYEPAIPIYVEKPAVTSIRDLDRFLAIAESKRIYASEYCTDGKCFGLLWAAGAVQSDDPRTRYLDTDLVGQGHWTVQDYFRSLGVLKFATGALLEGKGSAGTADHRPWLLDGRYGGMIRDLASHLFGVIYDIDPGNTEIAWKNVLLGKYEHGSELGTWRALRTRDEGETYAEMHGVMFAPRGNVEILFRVGKYATSHCRFLQLFFEHGMVQLSYEPPFELAIETKQGTVIVRNKAEQYSILSLVDFKRFIEGKASGHIGRAAVIVRFNEAARGFGLRQLGL